MFRPDAPQPLGLGLPLSERLRLLSLPLPATPLAGRLVVALGAPGAEAVAAAGVGAEFGRGLLFSALTAFLRHSGLFLTFPRGKLARGVRDRPLKKRPSDPLRPLQVRVPMAPSTERREVRALIRSPILGSDNVVTDEALSLPTLRAAVAISLLHPCCLLLPPALVQRGTGRARPAHAGVKGTGEKPPAPAELLSHGSWVGL
jgi:hypothetical protein